MQIVIDIDEDYYKIIKHDVDQGMDYKPCVLIANGTPLPERHGRLKDIDKIISDGMSKAFCDWYDEMKYASTIIEADKAEE
jgi:hypothetical protein